MKRVLVLVSAVLLLALATPAFAEWELGASFTPVSTNTDVSGQQKWDAMWGTHIGLSWFILYGSWDAIAVPNFMVENMTNSAFSVPGFINLFDAGIRIVLSPLVGFAEVGTNALWVYQEGLLKDGLGANLRVGLGLKFGGWGVNVAGTSVFSSFSDLKQALQDLASQSSSTQKRGWNEVTKGMFPSAQLGIYF